MSEIKEFRNKVLGTDDPVNIKDIDPVDVDEVSSWKDFPDDMDELLIQDDKGNLIFKFEGRENIREFLCSHNKEINQHKLKKQIERYEDLRKSKV